MQSWLTRASVACAAVVFTVTPSLAEPSAGSWTSADTLGQYEIFELSIVPGHVYDDPFMDVSVESTFTSPTGRSRHALGFHHDRSVWKVRFSPDEVGSWTYEYRITGPEGAGSTGRGSFACTPSAREGPVRRHPTNPYRWVFANGQPYFPIGLQDCIRAQGTVLLSRLRDGEGADGQGHPLSPDEYLSIYSQAGFNLFRFSQRNCSYRLFDDLDHYRQAESLATDELLMLARKHGLRVMFGFFGYHAAWREDETFVDRFKRMMSRLVGPRLEAIRAPEDLAVVAKEKRFVDYAVARWGVYVDFWELLNEREASDEWTTLMANQVRAVDPDRKPIATSWEKPHLEAIDINAPHWYEAEDELQSDLRVQEQAVLWKDAGKPVMVGEQGNRGNNWDPRSATRMRIRAWTALFEEISLIFWNTSWSKAGARGNIYLGSEERGYVRVLQDFAARLDPDVRLTAVQVASPQPIRAYGLSSPHVAAVYLHHAADRNTPVDGARVTLDLPVAKQPAALVGEWIDPSTGKRLMRNVLRGGRQTLQVPAFGVDMALLVESTSPGSPTADH